MRTSQPVGLDGEHQARADGLAVELHRARAADAVLAADLRAGQALVADEVREQRARLDLGLVGRSPLMRSFIGGPPRSSARRVTLGDERAAVVAARPPRRPARRPRARRRPLAQRRLGARRAARCPSSAIAAWPGASTTAAPASGKSPRVRANSAYAVRAPGGSGGTRSRPAARRRRSTAARQTSRRSHGGERARSARRARQRAGSCGARVGVDDRPADRPARARRDMADVADRLRPAAASARRTSAERSSAAWRTVAPSRSAPSRRRITPRPGAVDVDEPRRPREPRR